MIPGGLGGGGIPGGYGGGDIMGMIGGGGGGDMMSMIGPMMRMANFGGGGIAVTGVHRHMSLTSRCACAGLER